ncbi:ArsR/SmtB family transcription factor [Kushneria phosphatilytica]|nr:metalloregulator ArsR/SmtB family transcription factor [Kushneria phosphatilytica]
MKACGSSVRLRMLKIIASEDEIMVSELNKRIDLTQSALSQHLKVLRDADLVQTRRDSQRIYYSIKGDEVLTLLRSLKSLFG